MGFCYLSHDVPICHLLQTSLMSEYLENVAITAYDLSKRATRILQENTLELSYEGSAKYLDGPEEKLTDLRKVLENSSTDREKAEVMKKLLAVMFLFLSIF